MRLDIRIPIGMLFIVLGAILVIYGPFAGQQAYDDHSLGINVNLWWGLVMLGFGIFMFLMGRRGRQQSDRAKTAWKGDGWKKPKTAVMRAGQGGWGIKRHVLAKLNACNRSQFNFGVAVSRCLR